MAKVWIDAGELAKVTILNEKESKYAKLMQEKPNFDKSQGAKKIYQRKSYIILKAKDSYIVYNTNKLFERGHIHVNNFNYAKSLIDLSIRKKIPERSNKRIIESLIRLSNDNRYINKLRNYNHNQSI